MAVPNSSYAHLSPATVSIFQISINAMEVPTIGSHKPMISSIPAPLGARGNCTFIVVDRSTVLKSAHNQYRQLSA